jgi:uncharacterized membrane protein YphA (DoxX/SURF4 family)
MTEPVDTPEPQPRRLLRRALRGIGWIAIGIVCFALTVWSVFAVYFTDLSGGASPRYIPAAVIAILLVACLFFFRPKKFRLVAFTAGFLLVVVWFFSRQPSNTRAWSPDVQRLVRIDVNGDQVIVQNVRNFDYRSETDFIPVWEDRTYDLSKLKTADYILSYWGSKAIAHGIVSFEFSDGQHLAASIETRKEAHETYSAVQGFFRQYELIYIFADERDVLRLRTNYRNEDVYVYRTRVGPAAARKIFMSYVERANGLHEHPEFYNALTTNCVTSIIPHAQAGQLNPTGRTLSWEVLLAGYSARRAYRNGNLDTSMSFEQLESRSRVNHAAQVADQDPDFANRIRIGLPQPPTRDAG